MTTEVRGTYVLPIYVCAVILRSPLPSRNKSISLLPYPTLVRCLFYLHGNSGSSVVTHVCRLERRGTLTRRHGERLDRRGV